jgi:hypothetical protein
MPPVIGEPGMSVANSCIVRFTSADKSTAPALGTAENSCSKFIFEGCSPTAFGDFGEAQISSRASSGMHGRALGDRVESWGCTSESAAEGLEGRPSVDVASPGADVGSPGAGVRDGLKGGLIFNRSIISSFCDSKMNLHGCV